MDSQDKQQSLRKEDHLRPLLWVYIQDVRIRSKEVGRVCRLKRPWKKGYLNVCKLVIFKEMIGFWCFLICECLLKYQVEKKIRVFS